MLKNFIFGIAGFATLAQAVLPDVVETPRRPFKFDDFL